MIICIPRMPRYDNTQSDWQANAGSYDRCPDCGGWKAKKAYRCRSCSPRPAEAARARWKENPSPGAGRTRARNLFPVMERCERCDNMSVPLERHHVDGDPSNNEVRNIRILCRRCHMIEDGRLEKLRVMAPAPKPPTPCVECGRLYKPLRRGLCHACNERARRRARVAP